MVGYKHLALECSGCAHWPDIEHKVLEGIQSLGFSADIKHGDRPLTADLAHKSEV